MPDHKGTSYSDGFGIFNKISEEEFAVGHEDHFKTIGVLFTHKGAM
jgi:hypothetical protein